MANHLTPEELSEEVGIDRDEVIRICLEEHVPIYQGKIDKTLFQAQLQAIRRAPDAALADRGGVTCGRRRACVRSSPPASSGPASAWRAPLGGRHGRAERLHQVDRRGLRLAGSGATSSWPSSFASSSSSQRRAVVAAELLRLERALEARDDLARERELLAADGRPATASSISSWLLTSSATNSVSSASACALRRG